MPFISQGAKSGSLAQDSIAPLACPPPPFGTPNKQLKITDNTTQNNGKKKKESGSYFSIAERIVGDRRGRTQHRQFDLVGRRRHHNRGGGIGSGSRLVDRQDGGAVDDAAAVAVSRDDSVLERLGALAQRPQALVLAPAVHAAEADDDAEDAYANAQDDACVCVTVDRKCQ